MSENYKFQRRDSKPVYLKAGFESSLTRLKVGGKARVTIQSMNNTDTRDIKDSLRQIKELAAAGCDITRLAVPDFEAAAALKDIVKASPLPVIADIHFDYRLAVAAIEAGVSAVRINPGNIGSDEKLAKVAAAALKSRIPMRVGVNSGSLSRDILEKYGGATAESLAEEGLRACKRLENFGFHDIVLSLKSSNVKMTIDACRKVAGLCDYPLHLGITEAGTFSDGSIKSAVGIGTLLAEGIGDTIRVSLTADPVKEVLTARKILKYLNLRGGEPEMISCPGCGRTAVNLQELAEKVKPVVDKLKVPLTVAVMGCPVNGPGEAKAADLGIAGGKTNYKIFKKGKIIASVSQEEALDRFEAEIKKAAAEYQKEKDDND